MGNVFVYIVNDIHVDCHVRIWESTINPTHDATVAAGTTGEFKVQRVVFNHTQLTIPPDRKYDKDGYGAMEFRLAFIFGKGTALSDSDPGASIQQEEDPKPPIARDLPQDQLQRYVELGGTSDDNLATMNSLACSVFPTGREVEQLKLYIEQGVTGDDDRATITKLASQVLSKAQESPSATM